MLPRIGYELKFATLGQEISHALPIASSDQTYVANPGSYRALTKVQGCRLWALLLPASDDSLSHEPESVELTASKTFMSAIHRESSSMATSIITLRQARRDDLDRLAHIGADANDQPEADDLIYPYRFKYSQYWLFSHRLNAWNGFHSPRCVIVVAEATTSSMDNEHELKEIVGYAPYWYMSKEDSEKSGLPEGFSFRSSSVVQRFRSWCIQSFFSWAWDGLLDRSVDRRVSRRLDDETQTPAIPVKNANGTPVFDVEGEQRYWNLGGVTVAEGHQGCGIDTALLQWGKDVVMRDNEDNDRAALETTAQPGCRAFFEELGFVPYSEWKLEGLTWTGMVWRPHADQ